VKETVNRWLCSAVVVLASAAAMCGGRATTPTSPAPVVPTAPSNSAPILGSSHPGTRSPQCSACHTLPVAGHTATIGSACAACHGANGACDPNGRSTVRRHAPTDNCVSCHPAHHGFAANNDCASCHFAARGTRVCTADAGPNLPGALASGCFGWPASEFSTTNKASVRTFLRPGDRAVEFSLRDTAGAVVTLSSLLATRPVLLVHGAFT